MTWRPCSASRLNRLSLFQMDVTTVRATNLLLNLRCLMAPAFAYAIGGCALTTPQQNLSDALSGWVGRKLEPGDAFLQRQPVSEVTLAAGARRLTYTYLRRCQLVVEVSPDRQIDAAYAKGPAEDCILPP